MSACKIIGYSLPNLLNLVTVFPEKSVSTVLPIDSIDTFQFHLLATRRGRNFWKMLKKLRRTYNENGNNYN